MTAHVPDQMPFPRSDRVLFARQAWADMRTTGAVTPSGRALARALVAPLHQVDRSRPLRVVELGPGTGCVTTEIVARLGRDDELTLVERNPRFAALLRRRFPRARVSFADAATALTGQQCADVVVCGLPFASLDPATVTGVVEGVEHIMQPGSVMTYFAYLGGATLQGLSPRRREAAAVLAALRAGSRTTSSVVLPNVPPARVWRLER